MISKKHFEGFAQIVRDALPVCDKDGKGEPCGHSYVALVRVAEGFARMARRENERFDAKRFYTACGLRPDTIERL